MIAALSDLIKIIQFLIVFSSKKNILYVQMYIYKFVIPNLFEECTNFYENRLN